MKVTKKKRFANGRVWGLETHDGYPVEVTDTFLPTYTKDAIGRHQNALQDGDVGDRSQRWMVGVSVMSGCPVGCKFCATGSLPRWRKLTTNEIVEQVEFVLDQNPKYHPRDSNEFKVNYTRMGEPFLNVRSVQDAAWMIEGLCDGTHHYISTVGIRGAPYMWIEEMHYLGVKVTLQLSVHSLNEKRRRLLIPYRDVMSLEELSEIRVDTQLKTTVNLTLVDESDFDIEALKRYFPPEHFFIKLSPINKNAVSEQHALGRGAVNGVNLV